MTSRENEAVLLLTELRPIIASRHVSMWREEMLARIDHVVSATASRSDVELSDVSVQKEASRTP
jgi:hypothetical protein